MRPDAPRRPFPPATCLAVVAAAVLAGCPARRSAAGPDLLAAAPAGPKMVLRIHGSNTIGAELAPALAAALLRSKGAADVLIEKDPAVKERITIGGRLGGEPIAVEVFAPGSGRAFEDLARGECDLGIASRRITREEVAKLEALGDMDSPQAEHVIGLDGIAIIVNKSNTIEALTKIDVSRIFAGKVTNWSEFGRGTTPIGLCARNQESGTFDLLKHEVLKLQNATDVVETARRFEDNSELERCVLDNPFAIGFLGQAFVKNTHAMPISEVEGTTASKPLAFNIATEEYPLSRRLYVYQPPRGTNPWARDFVEFALSPEGEQIVEDEHFVSLRPMLRKEEGRRDCAEMTQRLKGDVDRISTTFRFGVGDDGLDSRAVADLDRLERFLQRHTDRGLYLVGFADNQGSDPRGLQVSLQRAESVAVRLRQAGLRPTVLKCGSASPVATNATPEGQARNRRVEVYLR